MSLASGRSFVIALQRLEHAMSTSSQISFWGIILLLLFMRPDAVVGGAVGGGWWRFAEPLKIPINNKASIKI